MALGPKIGVRFGRSGALPSEIITRLQHNLLAVHRDMGSTYQLLVQRGFEKERDPENHRWKPLSAQRVLEREKRRAGSGAHPILRWDGKLSTTVLKASTQEAVVGANMLASAYAATHQFGRPEANIPARPWLFAKSDGQIPPKWMARLEKVLERWLERQQ